MAESRLFKPLKIGNVEIKHRIGMPSLTRLRATDDRIPTSLMKEYYVQRAAIPGTLILVEGTFAQTICGTFANAPGIWSQEQVEAWRDITDEVHRRGCFIFCQLFSAGRAASQEVSTKEGVPIVGPSAIPISENAPPPRAMTTEEINKSIRDFAHASKNAINAGFDGVECHAANGYLLDQFLQDVSNQRDDEYGGSIENRSRFAHEVMKAMVDAVGAERVGLRLSPWGSFQGMGMGMKDTILQYSDIIKKARQLNLAFLDLIEAQVSGTEDTLRPEKLDFAYDLWDGPILLAGGYKPDSARRLVDSEYPNKNIVVMFGRYFISNPDLVYRIKQGLKLSPYDRGTFYIAQSRVGYSDYPYSNEFLASGQA